MNPISSVSSRQGISSFLGAGRKYKSKESTDATEKLLEGMARGRSVSPTTEGDVLTVASAKQNVGVTKVAERISLLGWENVQDATSRLVPVKSVDRADNEKMQLQHELEIIDKLENLGVGSEEKTANKPKNGTGFMMVVNGFRSFLAEGMNLLYQKKKSVNENQIREINATIDEANKLRDNGKLKESDEKLRPIFESVNELGEYNDPSVVSGLCRSKGHILYLRKNVKDALTFFEKSNQFANFINFPDRLFVLRITSGIDEYGIAFRPEVFYKDLKEWLVDDEKHRRGFVEYEKRFPQVAIFRDGVKAVFEEEDADTEKSKYLAAKKVEQSIAELDKLEKNLALSSGLMHSGVMLSFLRNLSLVKQSRFHEALVNIQEGGSGRFEHLNTYIHCRVLEKTGSISRAVAACEEYGVENHQLSDYLEELKLAEA